MEHKRPLWRTENYIQGPKLIITCSDNAKQFHWYKTTLKKINNTKPLINMVFNTHNNDEAIARITNCWS